jgi:uncharacterized membrane protein YfcA
LRDIGAFVLDSFLPLFWSVVDDPRFVFAVGISILAGAVRGFSGFGSALVYIPLMSTVYSPQIAAATFVVIDLAVGAFFVPGARRNADFRQIVPLAITSIFAAQFGALALLYMDPTALRWAIAILVALVVLMLASGWRYYGRPKLPATLAVGLVSGFLGGAVQISGPPIIIYWLGSGSAAAIVRANFIVFFTIFSAAIVVTYALRELLSPQILMLALLAGPLQAAAMALGGRLFNLASEKTYRRAAYAIVALSAVAAMPVWDKLLR